MDYDALRKAGIIAAQARDETAKKIVLGASAVAVLDFCEKRIQELGGEVAWAQISPTNTAAHVCSTDEENIIFQKGDLLKLDIGVHIDGWIADTALSVAIDTNEYDSMITAAKEAVEAALAIAKPGVTLAELGKAQSDVAKKYGFQTVKNLCGHTIDRYIVHSGISIPSFDTNDATKLPEGTIIAIEPFITTGIGKIQEKGIATIFMQTANKPTRSTYGRKILADIIPRNGLPFTTRHLIRKYGLAVTKLGLRDLQRDGIIKAYPPLVEQAPVAQWEHTVILGKGVITKFK
jgi:methionyl aminopeptidase